MKNKFKLFLKTISISTALLVTLTATPTFANSLSNTEKVKLNLKDSKAVIFEDYMIKNVTSKDEFSSNITFENINYNSSNVNGIINIEGLNTINFSVNLVPSQIDMFTNNSLIGLIESIDDQYELLSFRIEKNASSYTLMQPNLDMVGQTVLTLGILDKSTNKIYFLNETIDNLDFDLIFNDATNYLNSNNIDKDYLKKLEFNYFELKSDSNSNLETYSIEEVINSGEYDVSQGNIISEDLNLLSNSKASTLISRVPDAIYKSGALNSWIHYHNNGAAPYTYSYITNKFAGTDNRITNIVVIEVPTNINWSTKKFSQQLTIVANKTVLYNVYTGALGISSNTARIEVNNATISFTSQTPTGVFYSRYYSYKKQGTILANITKAVVGYVRYVGDVVSIYETITAPKDLETGNKYTTYPTYAAQMAALKVPLTYIDSTVSQLKKENDYFLFESEENGINDMSWKYSFTVVYK